MKNTLDSLNITEEVYIAVDLVKLYGSTHYSVKYSFLSLLNFYTLLTFIEI